VNEEDAKFCSYVGKWTTSTLAVLLAYPHQSLLDLTLLALYTTRMPPYVYPLPTTTLLTFSSIFIDPSSTHTTVLADATSARTRLHLALKAVADQEPGASALAVVEVCHLLQHSNELTTRQYRSTYLTYEAWSQLSFLPDPLHRIHATPTPSIYLL